MKWKPWEVLSREVEMTWLFHHLKYSGAEWWTGVGQGKKPGKGVLDQVCAGNCQGLSTAGLLRVRARQSWGSKLECAGELELDSGDYLEASRVVGGLCVHVGAKPLQLCLTLCDPMNCSPLDYFVQGILQARYWSGLPFSPRGDLSDPGTESGFPALRADSIRGLSHHSTKL